MAKDPSTDPPEDPEKDPVDPPEDPPEGDPDPEDPPEGDPKDSGKTLDPEVKKAQARRDRALARAQKAEEEARRLKDKYEPEKADPVKVANRRLVTAEAKAVLAAKGLTDPGDQKALAGFLDLDSVTVTDDGDVDSDTIQERLETLTRILGKVAGGQRRVPRVDPKDRGGEKANPKDAQSQRRRAMLGLR